MIGTPTHAPLAPSRPDDAEQLLHNAGANFEKANAWMTPTLTYSQYQYFQSPLTPDSLGPSIQLNREFPPGTKPADPASRPSGIVAPDFLPETTYQNWHLQAEFANTTLDGGEKWLANEITFTFASLVGNIDEGGSATNYSLFKEDAQVATVAIFDQLTEITGLKFREVTDSRFGADIVFRGADILEPGVAAYAYFPSEQISNVTVDHQHLVSDPDPALNLLSPGNFGWHVIMHEIGHAMGLKHPFEPISLPGADDTTNASVMTYFASSITSMGGEIASRGYRNEVVNGANVRTPDQLAPHTYQIYDIYALQTKYGVNFSNAQQGNSTYVMDGTKQVRTINDRDPAGLEGIDTISVLDTGGSASGEAATAYIDLESGGDRVSSFGDTHFWIAYNTWIEHAIGGRGDDRIVGNDRANKLDGQAGADFLAGSYGNDTYIVDDKEDFVLETADEILDPTTGQPLADGSVRRFGGVDHVISSVTFRLTQDVENLTLTGDSSIDGYGNDDTNPGQGNILAGNTGDNRLDGGKGRDTFLGGNGNDTFVINEKGESLTELQGEGIDEVISSITFSLNENIENLDLIGIAHINGSGNSLDNRILGNSGNNHLDGHAGKDTMTGGAGDDSYAVESRGDKITEGANGGTDWVVATIDFDLDSNTENLRLVGVADLVGTGSDLANIIKGNLGRNLITSLDGNDVLDGGFEKDTMIGGTGNDTYFIDNANDVVNENLNEGTDQIRSTVTWNLASAEEQLLLLGVNSINGFGNNQNNLIKGNLSSNILHGHGGNDTIFGKANADTMVGGSGNDVYHSDNILDVVKESNTQGNDIVFSTVNQTLGANVERLYLQGSRDLTGTGNGIRNRIWGNNGANLLNGGGGLDTIQGGFGNDTYILDSDADVVTENFNGGVDLIRSRTSRLLTPHFEHLELIGTSNVNGTGNVGNNRISGNSGNNRIAGGLGNDFLLGGSGTDTIFGGKGNDVLEKRDTNDVLVELVGQGNDTIHAYMNTTAGGNIENIVLLGLNAQIATGNQIDNRLVGNDLGNRLDGKAGNDTLDGLRGTDTMLGGTGNDFYITDNHSDQIIEAANQGTDTVRSEYSYTLSANLENLILKGDEPSFGNGNRSNNAIYGNDFGNQLSGFAGDDTLVGGRGADTLIGSTGDDNLWVDEVRDVIKEFINQGTDTVISSITWRLAANLENLRLIGESDIDAHGNTTNNLLIGNKGANFLNGASGADTMRGSLGDDTYLLDQRTDSVFEAINAGRDEVRSTVNYQATANVEDITLLGTANLKALGNALDNSITGNRANNQLLGYGGNDTLDGASGTDTMRGRTGDDAYHVDVVHDDIRELANEGADTVFSSINWTLGANFEALVLSDTTPSRGTGNALSNTITGNTASNYLDGREAIDTMQGGLGDDTYVADQNLDRIIENFAEGIDLVLSSTSFRLAANLEHLTLIGPANINGIGNNLDNKILGNIGNNRLDGSTGSDTLAGGAGNDTYILLNEELDLITETANGGLDIVMTNLVRYQLSSFVENLTLIAPADTTKQDGQSGYGNGSKNTIIGTEHRNYLEGGGGSDSLSGDFEMDTLLGASRNDNGVGEIDTLTGGEDADVFILGGHERRYYDDQNSATNGYADYALITDYNPDLVNFDSFVLAGAAEEYIFSTTPILGLPAGFAIFHDSNGNSNHTPGGTDIPDETDELIAVIQSTFELTRENTLGLAQYL